jgi:hypothetical protein
MDVSVPTALAAGRYNDMFSGRDVEVADDGLLATSLEPMSAIAILAASE